MRHEHNEAVRFLQTSYEPEDRVAVFLKSSSTGRTKQRIALARRVLGSQFLGWLHARNRGTLRWNVYVSVNTIARHRGTRRRDDIGAVRHVFLDVDANADAVMATIERRSDMPLPSYVMRSSPGRLHLLWRTRGLGKNDVELLQRQLARELGADLAATASSQLTRLAGFLNHSHKNQPPHRVSITYAASDRVFTRDDFPVVRQIARVPVDVKPRVSSSAGILERARRYLLHIDPAISGQHGNQHTFQVACRLVRGFALTDVDALALMTTWNSRCEPPWTDDELAHMLRNARRYGREPIGGLLGSA